LPEALRALGIPYGYTVHDLSFACPTITFSGRDGLFCGGETDAAVCRACLAAQPEQGNVDIVQWRDRHRDLVEGARFVIAPSRWAAAMFSRYFPGASVDVIAHGAPGVWANKTLPDGAERRNVGPRMAVLLPDDDVPTVAVLGAIGPDKGARRIERMVALARAAAIRMRWVVIGYLDVQQTPWQSDDGLLTVHGRYTPADLPRLLDHYRAQLVVYPSAGPETFSFTLSEAWAAGRPVVVPPFGALAERVAEANGGWILDAADWRDDGRMLARIAALVADREALAVAGLRARAAHQPTLHDMARRTLAHYATLVPFVPDTAAGLAPQRIRDGGGYQLWWPPEAADAPDGAAANPDRGTVAGTGVANAALRLRRTRPGRALARLLPAPLKAVLRGRLR
jgi:glycosyltransferase involved in cell wall biosynthesis